MAVGESQQEFVSEDFEYIGGVQTITLPAGKYKLECWGAQGGSYDTTYYGGKGGYSVGTIELEEETLLYIYVGGQGTGDGTTTGTKAGGFNGGGDGYSSDTTYIECGGGGASDIRIGQDSLYTRVIVAGGGGGAGSYSASARYAGGAGGGTSGLTPSQYSTSYRAGTGGTQTARGTSYYGSTANSSNYGNLAAFGVGASALSGKTYPVTGGGGGWYGGGYSRRGAGGGGSGYVYNASTASSYPSGCLLDSGCYLSDAETKAGDVSFNDPSGNSETGHSGNGHVRISDANVYDVMLRVKNSQGTAVQGLEITVETPKGIQTVTTDSQGEASFSAKGRCAISSTQYLFSIPSFNVERNMTLDIEAYKGDMSEAVVTAATQTYSGSALTPVPNVVLNGRTVESNFYDVSYSNNVNAGSATIAVTGKGCYEGTASGTFTIAKAEPVYIAPEASNLEYTGDPQYLTTTGSTSHGTIQYSENGSSWSTTRVSKTAIGTYTTYWRLIGDSNHNDVASTSITTEITKMSRTLSFGDTYAVIAPSGTVTKTATVSAGSGTITYSISNTNYATINLSTGQVTARNTEGSAVVTATIPEDSTYQSASASYNLYVFSDEHDFTYIGDTQSLTLPPGTYQLQCWGAQGGSNYADSDYGITSHAGGKGGYSVGQLTISQATGVEVYVGGAGTSSSGGWNGGGGTTGSSRYNNDGEFGISYMGGGGGASDIRLSGGNLLSRMIVAGGGSGGAMCYKEVQSSTTTVTDAYTYGNRSEWVIETYGNNYYGLVDVPLDSSYTYSLTNNFSQWSIYVEYTDGVGKRDSAASIEQVELGRQGTYTLNPPSGAEYVNVYIVRSEGFIDAETYITHEETTPGYTDSYYSSGYAGGGTTGDGGYDNYYNYYGSQNSAGYGGGFGYGADQDKSDYRYCSGAGGGGWYGGGCQYGGGDIKNVEYSGGGSGWVNTYASRNDRPSGYTGLQLDSGTTYGGNQSFPATSGGNETGHSGNGYARITKIS